MPFTLRCVPVYGDKCFTRPAIAYMFGVRSLFVDEKALLMKKDLANVQCDLR